MSLLIIMANLIDLDTYREIEGLKSGNPADVDKLNSLITSVSGLIKTYCNNSFVDYVSTPYSQTFHVLKPTDRLFLRETPLIELVSVETRERGTSSYSVLDSSKYFFDSETDSLVYDSGYWPQGPASVVVEYKAGYASVPEELQIVAANLVTYYHKEQYKTATASVAGSTLNIPTDNNKPQFPGHIKRVLDLYRSVL
jgi:hypothetical protein